MYVLKEDAVVRYILFHTKWHVECMLAHPRYGEENICHDKIKHDVRKFVSQMCSREENLYICMAHCGTKNMSRYANIHFWGFRCL